jgi:hypothetical protein
MRIEFIKPFTNSELGNVWQGRQMVLSPAQAKKFIQAGFALEVMAKEKENGVRSYTARRKRPSKD